MDIVKKNILSIVCGVIALVCVVLVFFPLGGMYTAMRAEVAKSKEVGTNLDKVRDENRFWPTLTASETNRPPLKRYPTEPVQKVGKDITDGWTAQTSNFVDSAVKIQSDSLQELIPNLLKDRSGAAFLRSRFYEAYMSLMNVPRTGMPAAGGMPSGYGGGGYGGGGYGGMNPGGGTPGTAVQYTPPKAVLNTPLVGRMPPSPEEIKDRADAEEAVIRRDMPIVINGQVSNQDAVNAAVLTRRAEIGDQIRSEVAKNSVVYLDPLLSFIAYDKIAANTTPEYDDIFLAQVGLWLQQELCRAVYDVNKPAIDAGTKQGVVDAPIKRLIGIRFTLPYAPPPVTPGTPAPTDTPVVPALPTAKIPVDFVRNPLGQVSNDLYDVLPFRMSLIVEADTLPDTLAHLTSNRFITIRNMDVTATDAALAYTQGFIYGSKPLVQVDLRGQYLMLRKFIGPFMPPNIIRGLTAPAAGTPGMPGAPTDPNQI